MRKITELHYKGKEYVVVDLEVDNEFGLRYGTFSREFIKDGKITKQLSGLQMMLGTTVDETINSRKMNIDYCELHDQGLSMEEILRIMGVGYNEEDCIKCNNSTGSCTTGARIHQNVPDRIR